MLFPIFLFNPYLVWNGYCTTEIVFILLLFLLITLTQVNGRMQDRMLILIKNIEQIFPFLMWTLILEYTHINP